MSLSQFSDQLIHEQFSSDQYQLLHKIGEGGFGKVFKAIQVNTGQHVAIKFLAIEPHCEEQQKQRYIERFKRETALSSQLQHPNIVRLLDKGQINDDLLYGVFEYIEGQSLREHLIQEGALNAVDAKEVMLQVLDALVHAHQNGIVHRDIKPANIMLTKTGAKTHAKILDFGIGTLTQDSRQADFNTLTLTQETLGTPSYSAPEQLRGEPATEKTDLYVWGLVFLECLTGLPAITGSSIAAVYHKQLSDMQVSIPSSLLGHPIAALLRRVLIKNATDRVITGDALYQEVALVNMSNLVGVLADLRVQQQADDDTMIMRDDGPAGASMQNFTAHIERKQITVLAMRLSSKVLTDKELDLDIVDTLFRSQRNHCIDIATRYGATHVGNLADSVLFYFGYPIASDNDTRLCARTILDAISDIAKRNALTQEAHGVQINVHAGIHAGVFTTYATAMPEGHIANTAMALAREAGERQILCSEESRAILEPYSEFEYFGEKLLSSNLSKKRIFSLKGERRVEAFGFMRGTRNSHELVGRSNELEQSLSIFNHESTESRFTHIHGEAGIGKSRLLQEIRSSASKYQHLVAQCLPEHQNNALYPILTLVRYLYNTSNLTTSNAIETFTAIITAHDKTLDCEQVLPILLIWLNIELSDELTASTLAPDAQKAYLFKALTALLMSQSFTINANKLYIVEDIHWADITTIEFIQHFAKQLHNGDVLISTSRQKVPTQLQDLTLLEVGLKKLTQQATEDFIVKLFDDQAVSQNVLDVLVNRTDGIPLFIEELIDMLKQKKLVSVINDAINFTSPDKLDQVPTSLRESLQQKLDSLIHAKETAQLAATIGREFEYELLVAASSLSENQIQNDLNELVAKDLIVHQRSVDHDSYIFKHALVRDAAYESTNTASKEKNHNKIASILVTKPKLEALLIAYHYKHAQKFLLSSTYGFKAAEHTYEGSLYKEAFNITNEYFQIAKKINDETESIKWQLRLNSYNISSLMLGFGYGDVRIFEKAKQNEVLLRQSNESIDLSTEEYQRLHHQLIWSQISYHNNKNERYKAITLAEEALTDNTHKATYLHRLLTQSMLANNYVFDAQLEKAEQSLSECFALLDELNHEEIRNGLKTYGLLPNCLPYYFNGIFQAVTGQSTQSIKSVEKALQIAQKFNHLPSYLMGLNYSAIISYIINDTTLAKKTIERARQEFKTDSHLYLVFIPTDALNACLNQDTDMLKGICEKIEKTGQVHSLSFYKAMYIDTLIESKQIDRALNQLSELTSWCETQNEKIMLNKLKELKNGIC
ncbi:TOMM system kinase/cyclase fusion protein [Pseudoalteromonas phenolica]|uniref:Serine/threonine protein kinase n=1 Tax=Pseudoalteromonas phenolica TaxID=161398 RepID=A0A0S2K7L1_9GAMM|nr:TOMM system kinase/cyclase fusion protein [Pseudoalteromonas phenolica]ALO44380.1 Serine/threonine protein kinase [Pseudoalteromonas phenolica]MBE0357392.1 serine/threonine-protein kinase Stk1 [Pseudoalteromonas phenolica O-BC30]